VLTSAQGRGWCYALEDQGWASFHSHKRSQGLLVRRLTLAAVLVLGGTGAFSLWAAQPFVPKRPVVSTDAKTQEAATQQQAEQKVPPAFHYHVPFTEVVDAGGYPLKANGQAKSSLDVEAALKKHRPLGKDDNALAEAAVVVSPGGDDKNDRVTAFVQMMKGQDGKTPGVTDELKEGLREAVQTATGLPAENVSLTFVDAVVKSPRSGALNRRYYHELLANREANPDATALLPLVPVANYTFPLLLLLVTLWGAWRAVNVPLFGDFLIATEAEMNKVSWTTRKRLVQDTIVVLVFLALLTVFLLVIDLFWSWLLSLEFIGVLPPKKPGEETLTPGGNLKW
jgi:preprotein translocase SecE subunit